MATIASQDFLTPTGREPVSPSTSDNPTSQRYAAAFGLEIVVESTDTVLLDEVVPWLPGGWSTAAPTGPVDRRYRVEATKEGEGSIGSLAYAFSIDGQHKYRSPDFTVFVDYFESDIHHYIATFTRDHIFVHAGAVAFNGRAIVIPGRSYAGKSTLTHALLERGGTYYSDDYAIIDGNGRLHPFPRHLRMRTPVGGPQARVDPEEHEWPIGHDPVPIGVVAALRYDADAGWEVEEQSKGAGVLALLGNTVAARERPVDSLSMMAKAVTGARIVEGTRGEAPEAAEQLESLLQATAIGN